MIVSVHGKEVSITNSKYLIKSINITRFRGLKSLSINDFSRVNVFVGTNNSGKTSLLEAIRLISSPKDLGKMVLLALQRARANPEQKKKNLVNYLLSFFHQSMDEDNQKVYSIDFSATINNHQYSYDADASVGEAVNSAGELRQVVDIAIGISTDNKKMVYTTDRIVNGTEYNFIGKETPLFQVLYVYSTVNVYRTCVSCLTDYIFREGKKDILTVLQSFDPFVEDISIVGEDVYLYNSKSGSMPLFTYGAGLQKAVLLTAILVSCRNGVVLIDEIDDAIHVSAFEEVFAWFLDACVKNNVQAFITTHSIEALDAIIRKAHELYPTNDLLRIITLRKDDFNNITRCKVRSGEEAYSDRTQFRMELRI